MAKILIIEDERDFAEALQYALENEGYDVEKVFRGDDAWSNIRDRKELPDLILLDWRLPGYPGIHVLRWLRSIERTKNIPILMITARGEEEDVARAMGAGANGYFIKPFRLRDLLVRIRELLPTETGT